MQWSYYECDHKDVTNGTSPIESIVVLITQTAEAAIDHLQTGGFVL